MHIYMHTHTHTIYAYTHNLVCHNSKNYLHDTKYVKLSKYFK